ncbi:PREDICTED: uncharacterized protein LOC106543687, partial [Thamnophis sirtalis]|uniref:Uncharacterized protein LOC106543687 n=1 Tax=Thamnophis sirtalis TaxID=35019 RepID=A0A6I9XMS8_9SAUR
MNTEKYRKFLDGLNNLKDERDRVQKKTFTKWVNKHLMKVRKHINDLYEDLRDGHNLISLLEVLSGVKLPREKGRMRFHRLQNVQIALDFLKQRQVKLVNIRNDDITDGNPKLTLGLIWTIILHFQRKARFWRKRKGKKPMAPEMPELRAERPSSRTEIAEEEEEKKKFRGSPLKEEGRAEDFHLRAASYEEAWLPLKRESLEQGHVVQVREKFQGTLERAHLVTENTFSLSESPGDFLEGAMVIAHLLDNPAEQNREKVASQLVAFQRPVGLGKSRAVLVPLLREAVPGVPGENRLGELAVVGSWAQPKLEVLQQQEGVTMMVEESYKNWSSEEGNESLSSTIWGASYAADKGTISELSTPSPMMDQVELKGLENPLQPSSVQETTVGKREGGILTSQSRVSFSGSASSAFQSSSGYGSDSVHQLVKATGPSFCRERHLASGGIVGPNGRRATKESSRPAKGGISDIYISGESGDMSAKEKLLLWSQKVTAVYVGLKCTNFSSCWSDGKMFNAVIHRYRPDLVDMERVYIQSNRENLEQAFEIAERLGVTRLLDAEDVDVPSPDEKSVITYVSSIYDAFPKVPEGGEGISAT